MIQPIQDNSRDSNNNDSEVQINNSNINSDNSNNNNNNNNSSSSKESIEDDFAEQLRLKKLQLKRKLEQQEEDNSNNDVGNNTINSNGNQEIKTIKLNTEEEYNQILKESLINFNDSSFKLICNGPLLSQDDKVNNNTSSSSSSSSSSKLESFYKAIKWSPDGTCLLTCSEDKYIRLFEFPFNILYSSNQEDSSNSINQYDDSNNSIQKDSGNNQNQYNNQNNNIVNIQPVIEFKEFESVYDICWYPHMNSNNPNTCCFLTTSKDYPINLYDAFTGKKRCTYKPYRDVDDLESAYSIQFNNEGSKIYSGFRKSIKIFDIERPGDHYEEIKTTSKRKSRHRHDQDQLYLNGIISSIAFDKMSMSGFFAASTYNGNVGLFDERIDQLVDILPNPIVPSSSSSSSSSQSIAMGITQIMFSPKDSNYLFASFRKSNYIIGWDIRNTVAQQVYQLYRPLDTNQRIQFDIDPITSRYLSTGSQNGNLYIYDLFDNGKLVYSNSLNNNHNNHNNNINNQNNNSNNDDDTNINNNQINTNNNSSNINNNNNSIGNNNNQINTNNCLNSTSFHPYLPLLSTSFGERQFNLNINDDNEQQQQQQHQIYNNSFSIFKYN